MLQTGKLNFSSKQVDVDTLRIDLHKGKFKFHGNVFKYRDKDTRQIVIHITSLDLTGYGATDKKAQEMINFLMIDFFNWLKEQPHSKIDSELRSLGWKTTKAV